MSRDVVHEIETESYKILRSHLDTSNLPYWTRAVMERVIHASADLEYANDLICIEDDLARGANALRDGAPIVADVQMVAAGITSRSVTCLVREPETAELPLRYVGFRIPPAFVVGYGLDFDERYRNVPDVRLYNSGRPSLA